MIEGTVTAAPQAFAAAVKWAAKFLAAKPNVPVQGGLLLDAADDVLTITAMNEDVTAKAVVKVSGNAAGRTVVSGRLLAELVATFGDKPVEIAGGEDVLELAVGRWVGTLPTMNEADYPAAPPAPPVIGTVDGTPFADMIHRVAAAAQKEVDSKIVFACVHLDFDAGQAFATATDSYRAARDHIPFTLTGKGGTALALAHVLADVAAGFVGPDRITVGMDAGSLLFASDTRTVVMRQTALPTGAEWPGALMEKLFGVGNPEHAIVKVGDMRTPLKRAVLMSDRKTKGAPVAVSFGEGSISIASRPDELNQKGAEVVDIEYDGAEWVTHFNPAYFAEAIETAPGDTVRIALNPQDNHGRPVQVILTVPGVDGWQHLLMPIKVRG